MICSLETYRICVPFIYKHSSVLAQGRQYAVYSLAVRPFVSALFLRSSFNKYDLNVPILIAFKSEKSKFLKTQYR